MSADGHADSFSALSLMQQDTVADGVESGEFINPIEKEGVTMPKRLFIAATGQHCGKTTISLSLMHLARKRFGRVGYIKPIGPKCQQFAGIVVDKDAALMAGVFGLESQIGHMSPVVLGKGSTKRFLDGELSRDWAAEQIIHACRQLESQCDLLLVEGAGHCGVGSVIGLNNAEMAKLVDAPVVMVAGGGIGKGNDLWFETVGGSGSESGHRDYRTEAQQDVGAAAKVAEKGHHVAEASSIGWRESDDRVGVAKTGKVQVGQGAAGEGSWIEQNGNVGNGNNTNVRQCKRGLGI